MQLCYQTWRTQVIDKQDKSGGLLLRTENTTPDEEMFYHATEMSTEQVRYTCGRTYRTCHAVYDRNHMLLTLPDSADSI